MPRTDYVHDPHAPKPNTLVPAVCAAVFNDDRRILLQKRRDNGKWALPGGRVEISESVADAAIREVREETGIDIRVMHLIGVYSDPGYVIAYADGEVRRQFALLVACSVIAVPGLGSTPPRQCFSSFGGHGSGPKLSLLPGAVNIEHSHPAA